MKAIRQEDALHSRLPGFRRKVNAALAVIESAVSIGNVGVSFSGGKDSTVLFDLVRRVVPKAPAAFFDSGAELRQTYEIVRHYKVISYSLQVPLVEALKAGGFWGSPKPERPYYYDFGDLLIYEPEERFAFDYAVDVQALGLRAEESKTRRMNAARGPLYQTKRGWHLCPLYNWTTEDVWAYIASRELPYNAAYDRMAELGIERAHWRISTYFGASASQFGRYAYLKRIDPELWNRMSAEFPEINAYV